MALQLLLCELCDGRSLVGRKRASQGPILPFSGTAKRQRIADPIKNVS